MTVVDQETGEILNEDGEPEPVEPEPTDDEEEAAALDDDDANEPEPEPAEPEGPTPEEVEAIYGKMDKAVTAYVRKVGDIFGDLATDLILCPLCSPVHLGFLNEHDAGNVPDEVKRDVLRFLGQAVSVEYQQSHAHSRCTTCAGLGQVKTDSLVPQWANLQCPTCNGAGFVPPPGSVVATPNPQSLHADHGDAPQASAELTDGDEWNEPRLLPDGRENPNYGKMPHHKVLIEPWGITAGLTVQNA